MNRSSIDLLEWLQPIEAWAPGTPSSADPPWVRLRDLRSALVIVHVKNGGGTPTPPTVTLQQAIDGEGSGAKSLAFSRYYAASNTAASDVVVKSTASNSTIAPASTASQNALYFIPIDPVMVDLGGGYTFIRVALGDASGSTATAFLLGVPQEIGSPADRGPNAGTAIGDDGDQGGGSPLAAPTLALDSTSTASVSLSWDDAAGGAPPYTYDLQYRAAGESGWTSSGEDTSPATVSGLVPGTSYEFRVVVTDADEDTDESGSAYATTEVDPVFAEASFAAAADGTALDGLAADRGGTWRDHPAATAVRGIEVRGNRLRMTSFTAAQQALYTLDGGADTLSQEISCTVRCLSALNNNNLGPVGYADASADTYYGARYANASGAWQLYKVVAGSSTTLASYTQALAADTDYTLTLRLELGSQEVLIDGVSRITAADTAIQAPGRVGVRGTGTAAETTSTGWRLSAFEARQGLTVVDLFRAPSAGGPSTGLGATYHTARIPSPALLSDGTIVVVGEARIASADDVTPNDTFVYRWDGADWSDVPAAGVYDWGLAGSSGYLKTGPVLAHDASTDRLWMLEAGYRSEAGSPVYNQRNCLYGVDPDTTGTTRLTHSDDGGLSWATPVDITGQWKSAATESAVWTGNGRSGLVKALGPHAGRICFAVRVERGSEPAGSVTTANHYACVIYSDDGGATWQRGADIPGGSGNSTEIQLAEDTNGDIVAGVRNLTTGAWTYAVSDDGGATWGSLQSAAEIEQPNVNCGFAIGPDGTWYVSHPDNGANSDRVNLTIRASTDRGATWNTKTLPAGNHPGGTRVESAGASYSALLVRPAPHRDLLVFFERGTVGTYPDYAQRLAVARVPLSWLAA